MEHAVDPTRPVHKCAKGPLLRRVPEDHEAGPWPVMTCAAAASLVGLGPVTCGFRMLPLRSASPDESFELSQLQVSRTRQALSRVQAQCQVMTRERSGLEDDGDDAGRGGSVGPGNC